MGVVETQRSSMDAKEVYKSPSRRSAWWRTSSHCWVADIPTYTTPALQAQHPPCLQLMRIHNRFQVAQLSLLTLQIISRLEVSQTAKLQKSCDVSGGKKKKHLNLSDFGLNCLDPRPSIPLKLRRISKAMALPQLRRRAYSVVSASRDWLLSPLPLDIHVRKPQELTLLAQNDADRSENGCGKPTTCLGNMANTCSTNTRVRFKRSGHFNWKLGVTRQHVFWF